MSDSDSYVNVKPEQPRADEGNGNTEAASENAETVSVKVTDGTTDVTFKVKYKTPLVRVMDAFCKRTGKQRSSLRFLFDGERVMDEDTPGSLGMEDNDKIEALNQQTGGAY